MRGRTQEAERVEGAPEREKKVSKFSPERTSSESSSWKRVCEGHTQQAQREEKLRRVFEIWH